MTGGIGAGKSEAAHRLADHGALVIDADQLAREVVAPGTDGLREVVAEFGTAVPPATHAWFIGVHRGLGFAILVEDGGVGGRVAAPLAARFAEELSLRVR